MVDLFNNPNEFRYIILTGMLSCNPLYTWRKLGWLFVARYYYLSLTNNCTVEILLHFIMGAAHNPTPSNSFNAMSLIGLLGLGASCMLHSQTNHSFHLINSTPLIKLRKNWFVCSFRPLLLASLLVSFLFFNKEKKESRANGPQPTTQPQKQSICSFLLKLNDFVGLLHRSPLVSFLGWLPAACSRP